MRLYLVDLGHIHREIEFHHQVGAELLQLLAGIDGLGSIEIICGWGRRGESNIAAGTNEATSQNSFDRVLLVGDVSSGGYTRTAV